MFCMVWILERLEFDVRKINRNILKENRNESHTLKKLRNRRIINPEILNSDTIDSNVQTTEKDNKKKFTKSLFLLAEQIRH
ncbi:hypothetical protein BpHYR1_020824 [Brachionus plicatilis]|uniref:Uncharacterized protein n=1 Tax=Brachionus plicatilis TaxID=10195 RepID=A0A3M7PJR1_BRAPC|nr:hypothetical protein BpHYR1_020824 [Brachionus plicatilis]